MSQGFVCFPSKLGSPASGRRLEASAAQIIFGAWPRETKSPPLSMQGPRAAKAAFVWVGGFRNLPNGVCLCAGCIPHH